MEIANYWGDEYTKKLPKTMVVDLSKKNAWALGAEITLDTKGEDEELEVNLNEIPAVIEDFDDDATETREEKGAAGGIQIMENNENEDNPETANNPETPNNSPLDDTSDEVSLADDDEADQARRLRTMSINEWLTNEKVQDIMERIQAATKQGRNSGTEAIVAIGDTINDAQMGMDQAFTAGTLATPAGVARDDSSDYAQEMSDKDVKLAAAKARTYLKQAIDKTKALAEDDFKQVRHWLERDEDTFIITTDFLRKIKNEAKRSLKLTISKINNPGSLGANPKKKLPSKNAYPILQITKDETDNSKDKRTKEWVINAHDVTPSAPAEDDEDDPNTRPPNYDQSVQQQQRATQQGHQVHFNPNIVQYVQPSMIPNNEFQYFPQATSQINMSKEWITEQKEKMRQTLKKEASLEACGITTLKLQKNGTTMT